LVPLAASGSPPVRLIVPDRRGYGQSPAADGEDFMRDGDETSPI
jgi:pimeloyl-ACP methyl ester carboxylesterase